MQRVLDGIPDTILKPQPITPPERLDQVDENQPLNVAGILQHVGPAPSPVKPPALPRRTICLQWGAWTALQHRLTTHIYFFFFFKPLYTTDALFHHYPATGDQTIPIDMVGSMSGATFETGQPLLVMSVQKRSWMGLISLESSRLTWCLPPPSWLKAPRRLTNVLHSPCL